MKTVTIHDAKTNLSKYIAAAKRGEQVYIGGFGKAEVALVKLPINATSQPERDFSGLEGKFVDLGDAFSENTDKEIADLMINNGEL